LLAEIRSRVTLDARALVTSGVAVILALLVRGALHPVAVNSLIARAFVSAITSGVDGASVGARRVAAFVRAAFLVERTLSIPYASGGAIGHGIPHRAVTAFIKRLRERAGNQ